jgi:2-oxoglutarate ferredoxin oxidoreductase subunit beta
MLHTREVTESIQSGLTRKGFSFVEVLAPCPVNYGRRNKERPLDTLKMYQEKTIIQNGANPAELALDFKKRVVLGTFVDVERPTFTETYNKLYRKE